jgi:hypothetical protein
MRSKQVFRVKLVKNCTAVFFSKLDILIHIPRPGSVIMITDPQPWLPGTGI